MTDRNEINSLNSSSTHPLPPLEQCNGGKLFSLFSAEREKVNNGESLYDGGVFSLIYIPTFKSSVFWFETNIVLFRAVQRYIQVTKRFNNI